MEYLILYKDVMGVEVPLQQKELENLKICQDILREYDQA